MTAVTLSDSQVIRGVSYNFTLCDIDRDPDMAGRHHFNTQGKSYGVCIVDADTGEVVGMVYAPSEQAAFHNARLEVTNNGGIINERS
jgi:hypothetical protein